MPTRLNVERLRTAAKAKGHTTDTLIAFHTGVSPATISELAKPGATREPKVKTFRSLGRPYGLTVDELILDDEEDEDQKQAAGVAA